jgi:2-methylcitrate dehydratase PrpD
MTLTRQLVQFACQLKLQDMPTRTQRKLKLHILDAVGCGWAASATLPAAQAHQAADLLGGRGKAMVFGSAERYAAPAAAFANAMIINGLDHDDGVEIEGKGLGHPGSSLIAAAMAALDQVSHAVPGAELLAALAAGFEINNRLIHALQPSAAQFARAYGVAQHQAIGAAIVYGRIARLDATTLHHAVGLAATLTCVPSLHKYNWQQRPLVTLKDGVAPAAQAGVQAACLAQSGFVGSLDVLDGEQGYWRMLGSDQFAADQLRAGLGQHWFIDYGSFKRYPACRWLATALECLDLILQETGWLAEEIEDITVETFARLVNDFMDMAPANATDAQFSLPYTLAAVALRLPPGGAWYTDSAMASPVLQTLMTRVHAVIDPELEQRMSGVGRMPGARVLVRHRCGTVMMREQAVPVGSAARPVAEAEIVAKASQGMAGNIDDHQTFAAAILGDAMWDTDFQGAQQMVGENVSERLKNVLMS